MATRTVSAEAQALFGSDAVAHVWTNNADGSPQVSVVWFIVQGDEILFRTDADSHKARNLRRDDRIVLSIEDTERNERGFQRHLVIRGRARIEDGPDPDLMDRPAVKYTGSHLHRWPCSTHRTPSSYASRSTGSAARGPG